MTRAELKTKATEPSVADYIAALPEAARRADAAALDALYRKITRLKPKMWGPSIIGYGSYDYTYASGHSGTSCRAGFSPRKGAHTLYMMSGLAESAPVVALLDKLGKHTTGKDCLYIKKLADVDMAVLEALVALSWAAMNAAHSD